jgi:hypothetical protein
VPWVTRVVGWCSNGWASSRAAPCAYGTCRLLFQPLQSLQLFGSSLLKHLRLRRYLTPLARQLGVNALLSWISCRLGGLLTLLRPSDGILQLYWPCHANSSSNAFASFRSRVLKPSVNHP